MTTFKLALRNLWRTPRRTVLTTVSVVAGVSVFILGEGFISGLEENIVATAIDGAVGHVLVRPPDYPTLPGQHPVDKLVALPDSARALLDGETVAWTERLVFAPLAASGADALRVVATGYDPERDPAVFPREHWRVEGALPGANGGEIAVSHRVARLLEVKPGGRLILQARTHQGAINALEVGVSGIVRTGNMAQDNMGILVPQALARELLATELPSHVMARLRNRADAPAVAARLAGELGGAGEVATWIDETAELLALQAVRRKALNFTVFILLALAAFGIANTILMAAHERTREVGTLRALGMTEPGVLRLFLLEGAIVGLLGSLLGAAAGGAAVAHWAAHPMDFSKAMEVHALPVSSLVYTRFDPTVVLGAVVLGVVVATLASIYPARVASRMVPAEAVRAS